MILISNAINLFEKFHSPCFVVQISRKQFMALVTFVNSNQAKMPVIHAHLQPIPTMKPQILHTSVVIPRPVEEVFSFFSKADNLELITPANVHFRIITPLPIIMSEGTLIDYRIKLSGIPFGWKTRISKWDPPFCFIDEQLKGPYALWHHTHEFTDAGNGTTRMSDTVKFISSGWILAPLMHYLFVNRLVKAIFDYRNKKLKELFAT
jgi:ligand-binding SRPBCC domain-containing protein